LDLVVPVGTATYTVRYLESPETGLAVVSIDDGQVAGALDLMQRQRLVFRTLKLLRSRWNFMKRKPVRETTISVWRSAGNELDRPLEAGYAKQLKQDREVGPF
jgi:hypothetical protein